MFEPITITVVGSPCRAGPGPEEQMFRYRLHSPEGEDLGEATYAMMIKPGEEIHGSGGERLRVLAVVPFDETDESPFVGLLQVEAAA
jgi:hypothetical protein